MVVKRNTLTDASFFRDGINRLENECFFGIQKCFSTHHSYHINILGEPEMLCKGKTICTFSTHPLINWIMGVVCASIISVLSIMIFEAYYINHHISEWKTAEIRYELSKQTSPNSYRSKNRYMTIKNENNINEIDKIESFYDRRFVTLLCVMGALVTFAGVILPILLSIIQQQNAKIEKEEVKNGIKTIEKLSNDFDIEVKRNEEKFKCLYSDLFAQNAQNFHGFAESWFRQYKESGGVAILGAAIVYCGVALKNNQRAHNARGLRSNVLMLKRIDDYLSTPEHSDDKATVIIHLKRYKWPVSSSEIRACMEGNGYFADKFIDSTVGIYERIMENYGEPNAGNDE